MGKLTFISIKSNFMFIAEILFQLMLVLLPKVRMKSRALVNYNFKQQQVSTSTVFGKTWKHNPKTPPLPRQINFSAILLTFQWRWLPVTVTDLLCCIKQTTPVFTSWISMASVFFRIVCCQLYGIYLGLFFVFYYLQVAKQKFLFLLHGCVVQFATKCLLYLCCLACPSCT